MRAFLFAVIWLFVSSSMASIEVHTFQTPQQEALYNDLIAELRCLVCQNQNLADSNSALAQDLRGKTYEMVSSGASREQIIAFMVDRYGDFVLYKPPVKSSTLLLWLGPLLFLLLGLGVLFSILRNKRKSLASPLSDADHQRAAQLLAKDKP